MLTGLIVSVVLIILSPTVWEDVFQKGVAKEALAHAPFPMKNPALISMLAAFAVGIIVSLMTKEQEAEDKFDEEMLRAYVGIGAE